MKIKKLGLLAIILTLLFSVEVKAYQNDFSIINTNEEQQINIEYDNQIVEFELNVYLENYNFENNNINYYYASKENISYGLYSENNQLISLLTSDTNGHIYYKDILEPGKYYFKQSSSITNYKQDTNKYYFEFQKDENNEVNNLGKLYDFYIDLLKSKVLIFVSDAITSEKLEGIKVKLLNDKEKELTEFITNKLGKIEVYLPYAIYYLKGDGSILSNKGEEVFIKIKISGMNMSFTFTKIEVPDDSENAENEDVESNTQDDCEDKSSGGKLDGSEEDNSHNRDDENPQDPEIDNENESREEQEDNHENENQGDEPNSNDCNCPKNEADEREKNDDINQKENEGSIDDSKEYEEKNKDSEKEEDNKTSNETNDKENNNSESEPNEDATDNQEDQGALDEKQEDNAEEDSKFNDKTQNNDEDDKSTNDQEDDELDIEDKSDDEPPNNNETDKKDDQDLESNNHGTCHCPNNNDEETNSFDEVENNLQSNNKFPETSTKENNNQINDIVDINNVASSQVNNTKTKTSTKLSDNNVNSYLALEKENSSDFGESNLTTIDNINYLNGTEEIVNDTSNRKFLSLLFYILSAIGLLSIKFIK
ncbi:MAG: hypothetical protein J1F35_07075 [Erysipelotrichales bacterium]|nr:hypothetical protein [Erysipelotrichales bacterium]